MNKLEKQIAHAEANAAGTARQPITPRWLKIPAAVAYTGISRSREHRREDSATSTIQTLSFPASHLTLHRMNEELRACTTCNACVEECPITINPLDIIVQLRRNLVMEESNAPAEWTGMFTNMENNGAPWQFSQQDRLNWAKE